MLIGDDDHTVHVRQIRHGAHNRVRVHVNVNQFACTHMGDEQPSPPDI